MIISKSMAKGVNALAVDAQFKEVKNRRAFGSGALTGELLTNDLSQSLNKKHGLKVNAGSKPFTLYKEFDSAVTEVWTLDDGDVILNDIMPLSRMLPFGRTVLESARSSEAGIFTQSISGEAGTVYDAAQYDLESTMIPMGQNGFKRQWRQAEQLALEGFQDLMIQQREAIRTHRRGLVDSLLNGHKDKAGNFITEKGVQWKGLRADGRVDQVDLSSTGFVYDFTDSAMTGAQAKEGFLKLAQRRRVDNKVMARAKYYISNEIYFNLLTDYSDNYKDGSKLDVIKRELAGMITDIVPSSVLEGNQVLSIPLDSQFFQPVVGMGVSTIPRSRPDYDSPLAFDIVSAIGWDVKNDFDGLHKAVQYAAS